MKTPKYKIGQEVYSFSQNSHFNERAVEMWIIEKVSINEIISNQPGWDHVLAKKKKSNWYGFNEVSFMRPEHQVFIEKKLCEKYIEKINTIAKKKIEEKIELSHIIKKIENKRNVQDGIYDATNIEYLRAENNLKEVQAFIKKYPSCYVACACGTSCTLLLSKKPRRWKGKRIGSGFNYGSTNILTDCPKNLLILSEND